MSQRDDTKTKLDELRKRAEAKLNDEIQNREEVRPEDIPRLLFDLHTHQIELEMQNEELRQTQEALVEAHARYVELYNLAPIGYLTINAKGLILEINLTLVKMLESEPYLLLEQPFSSFVVKAAQDTYYMFISQLFKTKKQQSCELRIRTHERMPAGEVTKNIGGEEKSRFWVRVDGRPLLDDSGEVDKVNLSVCDIRDYKQARDKLEHLATHDQLTHLPNRYLMETELNQRINAAKRFEEQLAILFIDLDHFKVINDTMGHEHGDILLQKVAKRLSAQLRDYDTVARFGGDEFVLLMPQIRDTTEIAAVADKIIREFSNVFHLNKQQAFVTASVGISLYPDDGTTVGELLQNADAAMYRAKDAGRDRYCFFTQIMNDELRRHQLITSELRISLARQDFSLYYQPLVDAQSGSIKCCEALIRWISADGETISPAEFIPVAEKSELINRIGEWVINESCRQKAEWKEKGLAGIRIDINLSGKQFLQHDIFTVLMRSLESYHLTTSDIGIELTENVLIEAVEHNLSNLRQLDKAGIQISIDDFGTGYSSLSYLRRFPVHNLKIDQEFVRDAPHHENDRSIMEAIVAVGHRLGLKVVVEGVETEDQHRLAKEIGCDLEQGYFFHKPMNANEVYTVLARQQGVQ